MTDNLTPDQALAEIEAARTKYDEVRKEVKERTDPMRGNVMLLAGAGLSNDIAAILARVAPAPALDREAVLAILNEPTHRDTDALADAIMALEPATVEPLNHEAITAWAKAHCEEVGNLCRGGSGCESCRTDDTMLARRILGADDDTPSPRIVTTVEELEALIQSDPRAVLELPDGNLCRAEKFRSLFEGYWERGLPATVLSPATPDVAAPVLARVITERQFLDLCRALDPDAWGKRPDGSWLTDWTPGKGQMREAVHYSARQKVAERRALSALKVLGIEVSDEPTPAPRPVLDREAVLDVVSRALSFWTENGEDPEFGGDPETLVTDALMALIEGSK